MFKVLFRVVVFVCLIVGNLVAQSPQGVPKDSEKFKEVGFLIGDWAATSADTATGAFSFHLELNDQVLVRHSFADYGKGNRHDDVMYIFRESASAPLRAIYFDSEGHVIRYDVTATANAVTFESAPSKTDFRSRLSYQLTDNEMKGKFEIAMPGSDYKPLKSWVSTKK